MPTERYLYNARTRGGELNNLRPVNWAEQSKCLCFFVTVRLQQRWQLKENSYCNLGRLHQKCSIYLQKEKRKYRRYWAMVKKIQNRGLFHIFLQALSFASCGYFSLLLRHSPYRQNKTGNIFTREKRSRCNILVVSTPFGCNVAAHSNCELRTNFEQNQGKLIKRMRTNQSGFTN